MGGGGWLDGLTRAEKERLQKEREERERLHKEDVERFPEWFYIHFREIGDDLERRIDESEALSDKDRKRLDKAVTVMKVSFKVMKKVVKSRKRRRVDVAGRSPSVTAALH